MNRNLLKKILANDDLSLSSKLIGIYMQYKCGSIGASLSYSQISDDTKLCRPVAVKGIKELVIAGFIRKETGKKSGKNVYIFTNDDVLCANKIAS